MNLAGRYDLSAPIAEFDPVWGVDLTGYRYTAVLTFQRASASDEKRIGTFSDFRLIGSDGVPEPWIRSGWIENIVGVQGEAGFRLAAEQFEWTAIITSPSETVDNGSEISVITGRFGSGLVSGPFTATRLPDQ